MLASIAASTVAFFATRYYAKRWLDDQGIPKGMTRGALVFSIAMAVAYGVAWLVDRIA